MQAVFTIDEFCEAHRISRALFYELAREGKAPRVMCVGRRRLVSQESAADWRTTMEQRPEHGEREAA